MNRSFPTRMGRLPRTLLLACKRLGIQLPRQILLVSITRQRMTWCGSIPVAPVTRIAPAPKPPVFRCLGRYVISTSRYGVGQVKDSNRTPLGLHRVARKAGGGWPIGTVLVNRQNVGLTWRGRPDAPIAHRVLWLEGLEPGYNRGGNVDTFDRYIYVHGVGDETTLGRPASRGCIHVAAADLLPLYDRIPIGTLVWIAEE